MTAKPLKVGVAGLGTIGLHVARVLDAGGIDGLQLAAVCSRSKDKAEQSVANFRNPPPVTDSQGLAEICDIVVECVPKAAFLDTATHAMRNGCTLVTVSGAAIIANLHIIEAAKKNGARIVLATGAILGLDAIRAAAEGTIHSVTMVTRKPPKSLVGAPYLAQHGIDVMSFKSATRVFQGTAAEGAIGFPSNVNVAAAVGLAGIGAERTQLEIWGDPALQRNTHTVLVDADSARFSMTIENVPSDENPGTGRITALSVIAALRAETAALRVGS
jgi:aspartate dehydrogenase